MMTASNSWMPVQDWFDMKQVAPGQASTTIAEASAAEPPSNVITHVLWGTVDPPSSSKGSSGADTSMESRERAKKQHILEVMKDVHLISESESWKSSNASQEEKEAQAQESRMQAKNSAMDSRANYANDTSTQAELHKVGKCTPCHYMTTRLTCRKGQSCLFCHEPHEKQAKPRPRKAKRAHCKKVAQALDDLCLSQPEVFQDHVQSLLKQGSYMSMVVKSKLRSMEKADGVSPTVAKMASEAVENLAHIPDKDGDEEDEEVANGHAQGYAQAGGAPERKAPGKKSDTLLSL